jgi:hypothetical protein
MFITTANKKSKSLHNLFLFEKPEQLTDKTQQALVKKLVKNDPDSGLYFLFDGEIMTIFVKVSDKTSWQELEKLRKKAAQAFSAW